MARRRRRPFHVHRARRKNVPYRLVWRTVHGRRMRVKLYPPAGSPDLLETEEALIYFGKLPAWKGQP